MRGAPLLVYLAHPFTGDPAGNLDRVTRLARRIIDLSMHGSLAHRYAPIVPHLLLSVFAEDSTPHLRPITEIISARLVECCDELWVLSHTVSAGMRLEISAANSAGIPVVPWSELLAKIPELDRAS